MSEALLSNPCLSCTTFSASSKLAQTMTKTDCIDNIWERCSSQSLESGCLLSDLLSLDHSRNHEAREKLLQDCFARDIEAIASGGQHPEEGVLVRCCERSRCVCDTIGPVDSESCRRCTRREVHVFSDSVLCLGKSATGVPDLKFTPKWTGNLEF